jgi:hypothetical protein
MMRRRLVVVAVLVVVAAGACSKGGGGGGQAAPTTLPSVEGPAPSVTTTTAPGTIETFEVFSTKNPFTPLVGPAGSGGTTGTVPATGGTTGGTTGTGGGTAGGTGGASDGTTAGVEPQTAQRVALQDVFSEGGAVKANVRVNSTVYKVGVGETFADRYKVLSLDQSSECGRFLFGDSAFRLCRGEQTLK